MGKSLLQLLLRYWPHYSSYIWHHSHPYPFKPTDFWNKVDHIGQHMMFWKKNKTVFRSRMTMQFCFSFGENLEAFGIVIICSNLFCDARQWIIMFLLLLFPLHHPASFSFSWLYHSINYSFNACGSKPNTVWYLHFSLLWLPIEREICALKGLTFSSKSFADFKKTILS